MENTTQNNYSAAVQRIKAAILQSQYQAAKGVNAVMLSLYYGIGQYVSANSRKGHWGTGAIENISAQLRRELPGLRGFSAANIKQMRLFHEAWCESFKSSAVADDLKIEQPSHQESQDIDTLSLIEYSHNQHFPIDINEFMSLGFTLHMEILFKAKTLEERLFYIRQAAQHQWSKYTLRDNLKADLFHHLGALPNNFAGTMPGAPSALKAMAMFKDEYLLDFINVEEMGERDKADIDERVVENAIVHNIKKFIMTFGKDFAFVGNQYHLEVFGEEFFPDLIFFNRELNALVCIELKIGDFKPTYLGQLTTYLRILDDKVRKPHENPTIGLVLCKSANKDFVEYVIQDYGKPMGVATYSTSADMPENLRRALPDMEELKKLL